MSHLMTALAMRQTGLKPAAKMVLYWLADHHNGETGHCFPSLNTLAKECEMSRATVVRHLDALESAGLIIRRDRKRDNGSQTSTSYELRLAPVSELNNPCFKMKQPPVSKCDPHNLGNNNLGTEPSLFMVKADDFEAKFTEFWDRYPRKVGRGQAKTKYKAALKVAEHDEIMFGLSQQLPALESKEKQFQPHPATWLHGERWKDEIEQPHSRAGATPNGGGMGRPTATQQIANLAIRRAKASQARGNGDV